MYKIYKDDKDGKFRLQYFMSNNLLDPLYTVENLVWEDVERFIKSTQIDQEELGWIHSLIRLMDKQITVSDTGNWSVL